MNHDLIKFAISLSKQRRTISWLIFKNSGWKSMVEDGPDREENLTHRERVLFLLDINHKFYLCVCTQCAGCWFSEVFFKAWKFVRVEATTAQERENFVWKLATRFKWKIGGGRANMKQNYTGQERLSPESNDNIQKSITRWGYMLEDCEITYHVRTYIQSTCMYSSTCIHLYRWWKKIREIVCYNKYSLKLINIKLSDKQFVQVCYIKW